MEIYHFESLPSTNSELIEMSKKNAKSWTVVYTFRQSQGKGYAGNQWTSEPDKNIALSVLIKSSLSYEELICFNQWLCYSVANYLSQFSKEVYVKWPNDIIIQNKKVCGILIETHKSENELNIISGIGINVNQTNFQNLEKAGSLKTQTRKEYDLKEILSGLLTELKNNYEWVETKDWEKIKNLYNQRLFRANQISIFQKDQKEFQGIIRGVDKFGQLMVETSDGETYFFKHKEIELKY